MAWPGSGRTTSTMAAMSARGTSGHSERAICQSAWATTMTATHFSACCAVASTAGGSCGAQCANAYINAAEGSVKPIHAAQAPASPARCRPIRKPTWLLVGPGSNWHSAISCVSCACESQCSRRTYVRSK